MYSISECFEVKDPLTPRYSINNRGGIARDSRRVSHTPRSGHHLADCSDEQSTLRCSIPIARQAVGALQPSSCFASFGLLGIEPRSYPPHGQILPLYYNPFYTAHTRSNAIVSETECKIKHINHHYIYATLFFMEPTQITPAATNHPVGVTFPAQEKYSRLLALATLFFALGKMILLIPHYVVIYLLSIAVFFAVIIAQFSVLFTGHYPSSVFNFASGYLRWKTRVHAYFLGLSDTYPPFHLSN